MYIVRSPAGQEAAVILTVGNTKGGVGKTTLAVNIAIARAMDGRDVLLVDGDEQRTAMTFTELRAEVRGEAGYTAVALEGSAIRTQVRQLAPKVDDVVIDVGGRNTGSLRAALTISDVLLIPVQPRSFDLWAVDQVAELVAEARELNPDLRALLVINAADPQGSDNRDTAEALAEAPGMDVLDVTVGRRKAFPNAAAAGRAVVESGRDRDPKAAAELLSVVHAVYAQQVDKG
jgi:chromosome partitioning protein